MKQTITKIIKVTKCIGICPFYHNSMDGMECNHPFWDDKEPYSNMIITHDNAKNGVPFKCPLIHYNVETKISL